MRILHVHAVMCQQCEGRRSSDWRNR